MKPFVKLGSGADTIKCNSENGMATIPRRIESEKENRCPIIAGID
jgi:hypothetical protein